MSEPRFDIGDEIYIFDSWDNKTMSRKIVAVTHVRFQRNGYGAIEERYTYRFQGGLLGCGEEFTEKDIGETVFVERADARKECILKHEERKQSAREQAQKELDDARRHLEEIEKS